MKKSFLKSMKEMFNLSSSNNEQVDLFPGNENENSLGGNDIFDETYLALGRANADVTY